MDAVHLKLNESKTEFIYFRSHQLLQKTHITNKCKAAMVNLIWTKKKHQKIHRQGHMPHMSQITSTISSRLLQLHTCRPTQKVNKYNATHTKHQSMNDHE